MKREQLLHSSDFNTEEKNATCKYRLTYIAFDTKISETQLPYAFVQVKRSGRGCRQSSARLHCLVLESHDKALYSS